MSLITYMTRVHFEDGGLEAALADELSANGITRPLIVTDAGVVAAGLVERLRDALPAGMTGETFDRTPPNPTEAAVRDAARVYAEGDCDGLVSIGGGSSLDLAKATGLAATHDGPLEGYTASAGGTDRIRDILPPHIAIPTTAGTGSEVSPSCVIILDNGMKRGIRSPFMYPTASICDPTLTLTLPPAMTAGTGMDALTHCVETYISAAWNPPADGIAIDGLTRAAAHLEIAVGDGGNADARREMMAAAMNGALAFPKGLGAVHAASHALGALDPTLHHGMLNAVLLPAVLEFNATAAGHRYDALARAIGIDRGANVPGWIARLNERIGIPSGLAAMGVDAAIVEKAAPLAETDHTNRTNPRVAVADDYRAILQAAM